MARIRPEIDSLTPYEGGATIDEIARRYGVEDIVKLGANENPLPPFPEVQEALVAAAAGINRYPDHGAVRLAESLADTVGVAPDHLWFGAGSSELLTTTAIALGGRGRSCVYPWPSFSMYPINSTLANAESVTVPLDETHGVDLDALLAAIRDDTTLVYLCNPNNPTGTYLPLSEIQAFVDQVPDGTLVVVDEAYGEYVAAEDRPSAIPLTVERPNVTVARTFSKIYGLAGLRIGYMVGRPETLRSLRKAQIPYVVNSLGQVAATTALRFPERVRERFDMNRAGVAYVEAAFGERGIEFAHTQANYVWTRLGPGTRPIIQALLERGTIIRPVSDEWARVSIGTPRENRRFVADLDAVLATSEACR
ncbi:MAG: histidinol-phosphate transaminase [bacterium]|nr:histidinol-phosphate transaminase [bacterium]MDE0287907.1 histidinol-phosphate transaminase [bacterium]MDE0439714.1 histidinol-phosphate transaminase [bacterium]